MRRIETMAVVHRPAPASPASSRAATIGYQPALDGVRALAVALVLLFHSGFSWMSGGYVGVSVFFTVSGYLITTLALAEWDRTQRLDVGAFYGRRVRRLIPASLLCIGGVVLAAAAGQFHAVTDLRRDVLAALAQVYNWAALASGDGYAERMARAAGQRGPLDHYWSLAIEEQFYWVWPLALAVILRRGYRARLVVVGGILGLAIAATVAISILWGERAVYLATPARLPEILAGCVLAVFLHRRLVPNGMRWAAIAGLGVVTWAAVAWPAGSGPAYQGWMPLFAVASTALVCGLQVQSPLRRLLSLPALAWLGRVSYGIYLFHWPVFTLLDERRVAGGAAVLFAVRIAVTLTVAVASYRFVERPIRARHIAWRRSVSMAAAACLLMAALAVVMPSTSGTFATASAAERELASFEAVAAGAALAPIGDRPVRVLVAGDSTAMALGDGMVAWAAAHPDEMRVVQRAGIGCGLNPVGEAVENPFAGRCADHLRSLPAEVASLRPDVVVAMVTVADLEGRSYSGIGTVTMSDPTFFERLRAGYEEETTRLIESGAGFVLWIVPALPAIPPMGAWAELLDADNQASYRAVLVGLADSMDRVAVADFAAWIATQDDPPVRDDGLHLSASGAFDATERYFAPVIVALAGRPAPTTTP